MSYIILNHVNINIQSIPRRLVPFYRWNISHYNCMEWYSVLHSIETHVNKKAVKGTIKLPQFALNCRGCYYIKYIPIIIWSTFYTNTCDIIRDIAFFHAIRHKSHFTIILIYEKSQEKLYRAITENCNTALCVTLKEKIYSLFWQLLSFCCITSMVV